MKIREICRGGFFTAAELRLLEALSGPRMEDFLQRLGIRLANEFPSISDELERRRNQRRRKRLIPAGRGGIGSAPPPDMAAAPAEPPVTDAAGPRAAAPVGMGGLT